MRTCGTTQGACFHLQLCVCRRRDRVQLCLVFISATQRKLGDEGGKKKKKSGGRGKEENKQANTCRCFSPSGGKKVISHSDSQAHARTHIKRKLGVSINTRRPVNSLFHLKLDWTWSTCETVQHNPVGNSVNPHCVAKLFQKQHNVTGQFKIYGSF